MSGTACPSDELERDIDGTPITVGARVEQTGVNAALGARCTPGEANRAGRWTAVPPAWWCASREDTELARIRPHRARVVDR